LGLRSYHAVVLRLVAPLAAKECGPALAESEDGEGPAAALRFENLTVQIAGRAVLEEVDLTIAAGEHVAIVGPSGAGKSSLIGLLLGWLQPTRGVLSVDGTPLDRATQRRLRTQSAWIDPAVRLWDESLFDNLMYGREGASTTNLQAVLERADLLDVLEVLPDGLQSRLGEGGAQLSGGQGQRVRIGRGMLRERPRLVLLDEPFRGLERAARRAILTRLREHWRSSTLLFVSHDIADSTLLDRVLVVEGGRIVEADTPARLLALPGSRYRALLEAEQQLQRELWQGPHFRHHRLSEGYLHEEASACP
ncbi:MAG: hypothetical protein JWN04_5752, partial [Myxococcaceae bacterium]|nr:hypothetical protein [Myxococcaceae bacterium]